MKKMIVCAAMFGASLAAHAQDSNWRFYFGLGASSGGDTLYSGIKTIDGSNQVVDYTISPGNGIQKRIGFDYRIADRFTLQASVGHYNADVSGYNGGFDFTIVPVEFMGFMDVASGLRIGAGLRKSSAELRATGVVASAPFAGTFKSDGGAVLEVQYLFSSAERKNGKLVPQFGISLRHHQ